MQRFDIINLLIAKYGYNKYLEIGVEDGHSINQVKCGLIHGVDPASKKATYQVTSDEYFRTLDKNFKYDIIFVDGLHVSEQVDRDIKNSLEHLSVGGIIVVHDCNPPTEWHQRDEEEASKNGFRQWNGDVWRSIVRYRCDSTLRVSVVDTDWGCGIIYRAGELDSRRSAGEMKSPSFGLEHISPPDGDATNFNKLEYKRLDENRKQWLNIITPDQFRTSFL